MADFKALMEKEAERLNEAIREAEKRRDIIDEEIAGYQREKKALIAYHNALTPSAKRSTGKRASRQDGVMSLLKDHTTGLKRADILDKLSLKGNKTGEQSISNALANLKKAGKITSKDGVYTLSE